MTKTRILTLALLCALSLGLSAQQDSTLNAPSRWWFEEGLNISGPGGFGGLNWLPQGSAYVGVNRRLTERLSLGLRLEGYNRTGALAFQGGGMYQSCGFALEPNLSWKIPITGRLSWTPRVYLSAGFNYMQQMPLGSGEESSLMWRDRRSIPLELGVRPASFDLQLTKNVSLNVTVNLLNLALREVIQLVEGGGAMGSTLMYNLPGGPMNKSIPGFNDQPVNTGLGFSLPLPERFKKWRPLVDPEETCLLLE